MSLVRFVVRPFGNVAYVLALVVLSGAARLLGERDELGYFAGRLARLLWRHSEITRLGVRTAWLMWGALFAIALSPIDPLSTRWDEVALAVTALLVLARRLRGAHRAGH